MKKVLQGLPIMYIFFCIFCFANTAWAKELYVAVDGDDSVTYASNDINNPWRSPQHAFYSARAGDIVNFRGGTYDISSSFGNKYHGYDGSRDNPITFRAYPGESAVWRLGPNVVIIERNYYTFDNLKFVSDGTALYFGYDLSPVGLVVKNCEFTMLHGGDNTACVRVDSQDAVITNNKFTGPYPTQTVYAAAVIAFRARKLIIRNNNIFNFVNGIYFKHSNTCEDTGNEFAYNYIKDCGTGIRTVSNYTNIHDNLIVNCDIIIGDDGGVGDCGVGGDYNIIQHNTLFNSHLTKDLQDPSNYTTIKDNIFMETNYYKDSPVYTDYNLYASGEVVNGYNLSEFQSHLGGCPGQNNDCNSLCGVPQFVRGNQPTSISGYALDSGSIGKNAASDGKDIGANVALVGVKSDGSPPTPPGNLREAE